MPNRVKDLTGEKFGRLTVLERCGKNKNGNVEWRCLCDCGKEKIVSGGKLTSGDVQSCGCLHKERQKIAVTKHGKYETKLYSKRQSMKTRCYNKKAANYCDYGARGITVCEEWKKDFYAFYDWAMSSGYKEGLTIDRIDVNGNYCPENCKWATIKEQNNNQRKSVKITYKGKTQSISQWAKETGIKYMTIYHRIHYQKWTVEKALTTK